MRTKPLVILFSLAAPLVLKSLSLGDEPKSDGPFDQAASRFIGLEAKSQPSLAPGSTTDEGRVSSFPRVDGLFVGPRISTGSPQSLPPFLKVGETYNFNLLMHPHSEPPGRSYPVKILQLGPGTWARVQELDASRRSPTEEMPYVERWLNLALLGSVFFEPPAPSAPREGERAQGPMPFPLVGTRYSFTGLVWLPQHAEVLETSDGGWFCAQEQPAASQGRPWRWWVNIDVVSKAKEDTRRPTAEASPQSGKPGAAVLDPFAPPPVQRPARSVVVPNTPPKMKTEYRVMTANTPPNLQTKVDEMLAAGWSLQGSVAVSFVPPSQDFVYAQAVVRTVPAAESPPAVAPAPAPEPSSPSKPD